MRDAGVQRAADREQSVPGTGAVLQRLPPGEGLGGLQLLDEAADAVGGDVHVVVTGEQASLLGEQEEHQPHHHGDDPVVQVVVAHPGQDARVRIQPVQRPHEQLDGVADLAAEVVGDLLLGADTLGQQRRQRVGVSNSQEAGAGQQRDEGPERLRLLPEQARVPHGGPGGATGRRPHHGPPPAVGDQTDRDTPGAQQHRETLDGTGRPPVRRRPSQRVGAPLGHHPEQPPRTAARGRRHGLGRVILAVLDVVARVDLGGLDVHLRLGVEADVRSQRQSVLDDGLGQGSGELGVEPEVLVPVQGFAEHCSDRLVPARAPAVQGVGDSRAHRASRA